MTISVSIKNEDTRENAIIEVISFDSYSSNNEMMNATRTVLDIKKEATLKGGENVTVYVTSTRELKIKEVQNG